MALPHLQHSSNVYSVFDLNTAYTKRSWPAYENLFYTDTLKNLPIKASFLYFTNNLNL